MSGMSLEARRLAVRDGAILAAQMAHTPTTRWSCSVNSRHTRSSVQWCSNGSSHGSKMAGRGRTRKGPHRHWDGERRYRSEMTPNPNPHGGFKPGSHEVLNGILVHGNVSGWYARLDRVLDDREAQIDAWLSSWERSLQQNLPIAAFLPETWPTLPANLITDPGYVLDHLLARHDAELDGRSPRGAQPIPTILSDSMVTSELLDVPNQSGSKRTHADDQFGCAPPRVPSTDRAISSQW